MEKSEEDDMSMSKRHNPDGIRARMREIAERNPEDFGPGTNPLEDDTPHRDNEIIRLRRQLDTAREAVREERERAAKNKEAFMSAISTAYVALRTGDNAQQREAALNLLWQEMAKDTNNA